MPENTHTDLAVLASRFDGCQAQAREWRARVDKELEQMDKRLRATEQTMWQLKVWGSVIVFLSSSVVGPVVVTILMRHFGR